jgi:hypothetical protein
MWVHPSQSRSLISSSGADNEKLLFSSIFCPVSNIVTLSSMVTNTIAMITFRFSRRVFLGLCASLPVALVSGSPLRPDTADARVPILLELFTSEGCSSCPPADKLLGILDREQPVSGVQLIVLSEHVDYWNHDGWSDPYSSHAISERQEEYASHLGVSDIYTPQLVIDGARQAVGANWPATKHAIDDSLRDLKVPITLSARKESSRLVVHLVVNPAGILSGAGELYVVLAIDHGHSHVLRGENAGREIDHVAIADSFHKLGKVAAGASFSKDVETKLDDSLRSGPVRIIAFLQDNATKRITGVAQTKE